nr:MAG TPA: hypothetical protein [Caudoviricetes sp.]
MCATVEPHRERKCPLKTALVLMRQDRFDLTE